MIKKNVSNDEFGSVKKKSTKSKFKASQKLREKTPQKRELRKNFKTWEQSIPKINNKKR